MKTVQVFHPIGVLSNIFALNPFTKNLTLSYPKLCQTLTFTTVCIYFTYDYILSIFELSFSSSIMKFVLIVRTLSFTFLMLAAVFLSSTNRKVVLKSLKQIGTIDKELDQKEYLKKQNSRISKELIVLIFVMLFCFDTIGGLYSTSTKSKKRVIYFGIHWYPRMAIRTKLVAYFTILLVLKSRFKSLNNSLRKLVQQSEQDLLSSTFTDTIDNLIKLHQDLVKISEEVTSSFSLFSLLWISLIFVVLIGDTYAVLNSVLFDNFEIIYPILLSILKNCLSYIFNLYYLASKSNQLCSEVSSSEICKRTTLKNFS